MNLQKIKEKNNTDLCNWVCQGDIDKVILMTTSEEFEGLVDIDYNFNYPLKVAAINGHIDIVQFLLTHPDQKKRSLVIKNIDKAIEYSIYNAQIKMFLFLKENYPDDFIRFTNNTNKMQINRVFDSLSMQGKLEGIELLNKEIQNQDGILNWLFLSSSIKYSHRACFNYWIGRVDENFYRSNIRKAQEIVHACLDNGRFEELRDLVIKFNLDLKSLVTMSSFAKVLDLNPKSLVVLATDFDYMPSADIMLKIESAVGGFEKNRENRIIGGISKQHYESLRNFLDVLAVKNEQKLLNDTISCPLRDSQNGIKVNKI